MKNIYKRGLKPRVRKLLRNINNLCPNHYQDQCTGDFSSSGGYGVYYHKGFLGIKVLRNGKYVDDDFYTYCSDGWNSVKELKESKIWHKAVQEYKNLLEAEKSKCTPKAYGVKAVKIGKHYYAAIIMQHISGETYDDSLDIENKLNRSRDKVENILGTSYDHHSHNYIVKPNGQVFLIDLAPESFPNS